MADGWPCAAPPGDPRRRVSASRRRARRAWWPTPTAWARWCRTWGRRRWSAGCWGRHRARRRPTSTAPRLETCSSASWTRRCAGFVYEAAGSVGPATAGRGGEPRARGRGALAPARRRRGGATRPATSAWLARDDARRGGGASARGRAAPRARTRSRRARAAAAIAISTADRGGHDAAREGRRLRAPAAPAPPAPPGSAPPARTSAAAARPKAGHQRVLGLDQPPLVLHAAGAVAQVNVQRAAPAASSAPSRRSEMSALRAPAPAAALERVHGAPQGRCVPGRARAPSSALRKPSSAAASARSRPHEDDEGERRGGGCSRSGGSGRDLGHGAVGSTGPAGARGTGRSGANSTARSIRRLVV